jgi:hypothetical protein
MWRIYSNLDPHKEKKDQQKLRELSLYNNARPSTSTEHFMVD